MRSIPGWILLLVSAVGFEIFAAEKAVLPLVAGVETQPLAAQVRRLIEATDYLGAPLSNADKKALEAAMQNADPEASVRAIQKVLDRYCLIGVNINPESRVKVAVGAAKPELMQHGWRQFLVKVHNEAGVTAELQAVSPNARSLFEGGWANTVSDRYFRNPGDRQVPNEADLWMDLQMFNSQPLQRDLSGLNLEYRIVQIYSRDRGKREGKLMFNVGQGTQDIGFRNEVDILFDIKPAIEVTLRVRDENKEPTTASFVIRDQQGRIYPSQAKRLAPDFAFHPQVYRADGETLQLPEGSYTVEFSRGPESIPQIKTINVSRRAREFSFQVERWIDPSKMGWWSGDHHIHAAGCAHYVKPTEGVHAPDMMRHCLGEDLKIGANLTWGPCFDYQKQFFTGTIDKVSQYPYLLRYDVEVSGFGSHNSGHLVLLQLKDQMYPGGQSKDHWPTLGLNTLRWAKKQGAVTGPAHSGWGLEPGPADGQPASSRTSGNAVTLTDALPNYIVPPFNGIGANEYIVDVTHQVPGPDGMPVPAVDFISTVDTPYVWELNIWYHTLNVGYRTRISGETDFPCIYGERVGLGRSYVKLDGKLDYERWCDGIRLGRNYVSDGRSHLIDFTVNDVPMGEKGSELRLSQPGNIRLTAKVAARLDEKPDPTIRNRSYKEKPYWHIERARVGETREVPVEVIVNGYPVARKTVVADGHLEDVSFDIPVERSGWVALRVLPSSHTNPVFVIVDNKPIRSKRSAEWCLKSVDQCWSQKERFIKAAELDIAREAYAHARQAYQRLLSEAPAD